MLIGRRALHLPLFMASKVRINFQTSRCFATTEKKRKSKTKETIDPKEIERFKEANQKSNRKFRRLLGKEVIPLLLVASGIIIFFKFRTQIENLVIGEGRFGLEALSTDSVRFISKRLASLLKFQYSMGQQGLGNHLIEVQLIEELYTYLIKYFLENGLVEPSFLSSREVIVFYSPKPELFILPNGSLFMSESLLE